MTEMNENEWLNTLTSSMNRGFSR